MPSKKTWMNQDKELVKNQKGRTVNDYKPGKRLRKKCQHKLKINVNTSKA